MHQSLPLRGLPPLDRLVWEWGCTHQSRSLEEFTLHMCCGGSNRALYIFIDATLHISKNAESLMCSCPTLLSCVTCHSVWWHDAEQQWRFSGGVNPPKLDYLACTSDKDKTSRILLVWCSQLAVTAMLAWSLIQQPACIWRITHYSSWLITESSTTSKHLF